MRLGGWMIMLSVFIMVILLMGIDVPLNRVIGNFGMNITNEGEVINANLEDSSFWLKLFDKAEGNKGLLVKLGLVGIIMIGLFAKGYDTSIILAPIIVIIAYEFTSRKGDSR